MNNPAIDIERVVREVLADMGLALAAPEVDAGQRPESPPQAEKSCSTPSSADGATKIVSMASAKPQAADAELPDPNELVIDARIVTMAEVSGRLNAVRRVVVAREALVTPAVRDELLRRNIALEFAVASEDRPAASRRLVLITMGGSFDPTALVAGLAREGLSVEHVTLNCLIAATDQLAVELAKADTLSVLLTRHTAAALCLANRLRGVRAILGADAPAVAAASAAVGANMLVANPQAGTFFQLKQMVTEFCKCGVRACPEVFHARLA
jgi:hypothetical protein